MPQKCLHHFEIYVNRKFKIETNWFVDGIVVPENIGISIGKVQGKGEIVAAITLTIYVDKSLAHKLNLLKAYFQSSDKSLELEHCKGAGIMFAIFDSDPTFQDNWNILPVEEVEFDCRGSIITSDNFCVISVGEIKHSLSILCQN